MKFSALIQLALALGATKAALVDDACHDPDYGPVSGGVDYVDLFGKQESEDTPERGSRDFSATLNGYTFWFKNAENKETFEADPWAYAPHCGGFCCWATAEGYCNVAIDIFSPTYVHPGTRNLEPGNYMQFSPGVYNEYIAHMPDIVSQSNSEWQKCHGDDRSSWPFNTKCASRDDEVEEAFYSNSIVETAQATPQLSSLVDALVQADLVDALSGPGPFTVFAPTNDAFDAISSTVAGLTKAQLQQVLEYHVISGAAALSTDLTDMEVLLPLFSGHSLGVDLEEGPVRIVGESNAVTVTTADVLCTNGVVHIVDAVLVPKLSLEASPEVV